MAGNSRVAQALSGLFGSAERADCSIQFCLEAAEGADQGTDLGEPLPAHSLVLCLSCERFRAQFERWEEAPPTSKRAKSSQEGVRGPVLRVPLGSEAELPAARLAIRFAYTGQVHASSIREAMQVYWVGEYLAIEGCAAACSQWLADRLAATEAAGTSSAEPAEPAVLQLYACEDMWPSTDPSFDAVLSAAKPQLLKQFSSTVVILNTPSLRQQLENLPAAGLAALLESDDLATDSEDSVLTLLAVWMEANWARTDAATRKRLCGLVRLTQLSFKATNCLLLPLALDFEAEGAQHQTGWFPVTVTAVQLVINYYSGNKAFRETTRKEQADAGARGWHSTTARKQCVPEAGLPFPWSISRDALKAEVLMARGFAWQVSLIHKHGAAAAGLFLEANIPDAYKVPGSRLAGPVPMLAARIDARLTVNRRQSGRASIVSVYSYDREDNTRVGSGWGDEAALPLSPQQPAAPGAAAAGDVMAGLGEYAHDGSAVRGELILRPK